MKKKILTSISLEIKSILFNQLGNFMGADGGGDGGSGDPGDGGSGDPGDGGIQWQYPEGFDESLKGNATLMKYADKEKGTFNQANIMKALVHATGMIGKDKVSLPDETWTDDQWNDLFGKLGKPGELDAYEIKGNLPEGMEENKEFLKAFKNMAFEANLLPKQANAVYSKLNEFINNSLNSANEMNDAEYNKAVDNLKSEWGEAYDKNNQQAYKALEEFATADEINVLKEAGFIQNPTVAKIFHNVAKGLMGDSFGDNKPNNLLGLTPDEAQAEINKFYQTGHPFMNSKHPEHAYYKDRMLKLQKIKLAGKR